MDTLSAALAQHIGKPLTVELARKVWLDAQPFSPIAVDAWVPHEMVDGTLIRAVYLDDRFSELEEHRLRYLDETHPGEPVRVQWERIRELERQGAYVIVTAERAGKLVASLWLFVSRGLNHGELTVTDDLMFAMPEARGGLMASSMCRFAEKHLFNRGVRACTLWLATGNRAGRLAEFLGYKPRATVYTKNHWGDDLGDAPTRHEGVKHG